MGFCHRCGEITMGKCGKCGGRSVASTISTIASAEGGSITDRWQSQYASTILSPEEILPAAKMVSVTQSSFYNKPSSRCACCSKSITSKTSTTRNNLNYCGKCHLQLFNKGECPTCQQFVSEQDSFIDYGKSTWHASCFTCVGCKVPLEANPLVDLQNRPCCEPCFMNSSRARKNTIPSPPLYPKQSRNSRRVCLDSDLFHQPTTPPRTPSPQATQSTSLSKRPCHYCHSPLGDASQKKTKVPLGDGVYAWFHKSCFLCSKCHLPFTGECATDGHSFYHPNCNNSNKSCFGCKKQIGTDAFQFNDKMYHFDCFHCYGNGCKIGLGQPVFEVGKRPFCQACHDMQASTPKPKLGGFKTCPRCKTSVSILDGTPGPLASRWHKKCLSCTDCHKQLDSAAKMKQQRDGSSLVYCRTCFQN